MFVSAAEIDDSIADWALEMSPLLAGSLGRLLVLALIAATSFLIAFKASRRCPTLCDRLDVI
jgi:hypothetical protein